MWAGMNLCRWRSRQIDVVSELHNNIEETVGILLAHNLAKYDLKFKSQALHKQFLHLCAGLNLMITCTVRYTANSFTLHWLRVFQHHTTASKYELNVMVSHIMHIWCASGVYIQITMQTLSIPAFGMLGNWIISDPVQREQLWCIGPTLQYCADRQLFSAINYASGVYVQSTMQTLSIPAFGKLGNWIIFAPRRVSNYEAKSLFAAAASVAAAFFHH